jgi:hypothetical protein
MNKLRCAYRIVLNRIVYNRVVSNHVVYNHNDGTTLTSIQPSNVPILKYYMAITLHPKTCNQLVNDVLEERQKYADLKMSERKFSEGD